MVPLWQWSSKYQCFDFFFACHKCSIDTLKCLNLGTCTPGIILSSSICNSKYQGEKNFANEIS